MTAPPEKTDVVVPVRPGEANEELRHALRSLCANLPHRRLWVVGHAPRWVDREAARVVERQQRGGKHQCALENLLTACRHPEVSEEFVLTMDDVFVLRPAPPGGPPALHRGPLEEDVRRLAESRRPEHRLLLERTRDALTMMIHQEPMLSYELHAPVLLRKRDVLADVATARGLGVRTPQVRTLVGNRRSLGGERSPDFKATPSGDWDPAAPYLSTSDATFRTPGGPGDAVRDMFPAPCAYERS